MLRPLRGDILSCVLSAGLLCSVPVSSVLADPSAGSPSTVTSADYMAFRAQIQQISKMRLDNPANLEAARKMLLAHDERDLSHDWLARCSDIAAQDSKFVAGVKRAVRQSGGADAFIAKIAAEPSTAFEIDGWKDAANDVANSVAQDSAAMQSLSYRLSEIAYGRPQQEAELAHDAESGVGVTGAIKASPPSISSPTQLMMQVLALGAVEAVAHSQDVAISPAAANLVDNKSNDQCLRWSDLNLKQCLAAARDDQERAYCLSTEGIASRSECWNKISQPSS